MKRGEVWWVDFDSAVGGDIRKTLPAVVVSNDLANRHLNRLQIVPLSNAVGKLYPSEAEVTVNTIKSKAMADQLMTADKQRLRIKFGELSAQDMKTVERVIKIQLGLPL
jgi:mRNA interferase MazF